MNTPVALIVFNRPNTTRRVFEAIRKAKPPKLFIIADAPREGRPGEREKCDEVLGIVSHVDWDCEVYRNVADQNMGTPKRIPSGLNWVFEHVDEAIVLEDDCLPDDSFFPFCEEMLNTYRENPDVMMIAGTNFYPRWKEDMQSYHFSRFGCVWGWATWKRAWQYFNIHKIRNHSESEVLDIFRTHLKNETQAKDRVQRLSGVIRGHQDEEDMFWSYRWTFARAVQQGLCIVPSVNLISNIGYDHDATNTKKRTAAAQLPTFPLGEVIRHPEEIKADEAYDDYYFVMNTKPYAILFGASQLGEVSYHLIKNWYTVLYYCDNDPAKWGQQLNGIEIVPPSALAGIPHIYDLIITSHYHNEIVEQLRGSNIPCIKVMQFSINPVD